MSIHDLIRENHILLLSDKNIQKARHILFRAFNLRRDKVIKNHAVDRIAKRVRRSKEVSIKKMIDLYKIANESFSSKGASVYFAKTGEDATRIALKIIGDEPVVVQSSTDMIGEIGLDKALIERGIQLIHTTATFRLVQRAEMTKPLFDRPNPIEHLSSAAIQDIIKKSYHKTSSPEDPLSPVRDEIHSFIRQSHIGITGANAVAAEDGVLTLAYSQGNTTLVASRPTHLAIIGLEKLVSTLSEAIDATYLQGLLECGANGARFYHIVAGPSRFPDTGKGRGKGFTTENLVLLFVDNNRTTIASSPYHELLYCIRCFTCIHYCPSYIALGPGVGPDLSRPGFGYKGYVGGRELVLAGLTTGLPKTVLGGLFACTLCGACKTECPLGIDIPYAVKMMRRSLAAFDDESNPSPLTK
ncbi:MAG: LUD domain-containing protein [Candidatus Ranarchaeia archaeon]